MASLTREDVLLEYLALKGTHTFEGSLEKVVEKHQAKFKHKRNMKKNDIAALKHQFHKRWQKARRLASKFVEGNEEWLRTELTLAANDENVCFTTCEKDRSLNTQKRGR